MLPYSLLWRFISTITDSLLSKKEFTYNNSTGLVTSVKSSTEIISTYSYNNKQQITSYEIENREVDYYNSSNLISKISQGTQEYNFTYDSFLNLKKLMIGNNITLVTNAYLNNNGNLSSTTYENENTVSFEYDNFNRLRKKYKNVLMIIK